jgi:hypothetical protein
MRFSQVSVLAVLLVPMLGFAQTTKMSCTNASTPGFTEDLTIDGAGTDAKVHVDDSTLSGDLTYDAQMTQVAGQIPDLPTSSVAYSGTITSKIDSTQGHAIFFLQAAILNGQPGRFFRMGPDTLLAFDCKAN